VPEPRLPPRVRRHGSGFRGVVTLDGRRVYGPTFDRAVDAADWVAHALNVAVPRRVLTLAQGFAELQAELVATGARDATRKFYRETAVRLEAGIGADTMLHSIDAAAIQRFADARAAADVSPQTIWCTEIPALGRMLRLAARRGWITRHPMGDLRAPKVRHRPFDAMSMKRIRELIERVRESRHAGADRDADVFTLFALTGLRRSEVARLRPIDVELDTSRIWVRGKTHDCHIPIQPDLKPVLERLLFRAGRAGSGPQRALVGGAVMLSAMFRRWAARLKEPRLRPHTMRHSFGTALADAGVHPHVLRDLMRHASLQETSRYLHSHDRAKLDAVSRLSLGPQPTAGTPRADAPDQDGTDERRATP